MPWSRSITGTSRPSQRTRGLRRRRRAKPYSRRQERHAERSCFMAKLNISPTKSNLLALRRQLAFAEEGYDLLDQKRQILVFELMSRLERARAMEKRVQAAMGPAY